MFNNWKKLKEQIIQLHEFKAREACLCVLNRLMEEQRPAEVCRLSEEVRGALRTLWEEVGKQNQEREAKRGNKSKMRMKKKVRENKAFGLTEQSARVLPPKNRRLHASLFLSNVVCGTYVKHLVKI